MMTSKPHPLYFIGAGPGDPRFLTREGERALRRSLVVYAMPPYRATFASLLREKSVFDPMTFAFERLAGRVSRQLAGGAVAFLVPGDLTVFSPFMPLVTRFADRARVIAGVGVVNAAAALLATTIEKPPLSRCVVQASPRHLPRGQAGDRELQRLAALQGTLVLYMVHRPLRELAALLSEVKGAKCPAAVFHRVGLPGERVWRGTLGNIAETVGRDDPFAQKGVPASKRSSLALFMAGEALAAPGLPAEWDRRKEKVWDRGRKK
jgi:precorrin-4/cobalt-precorrin-4 C11-methyltransferase